MANMSDVEKQILATLESNSDFNGAQDLIDAHLDEVSGGASFSLHVKFGKETSDEVAE